MRIKTFEAPTMQEALAMAKNELGEDAVVLNTKHVKASGLLGLAGVTKIELMAAIDDSAPEMPKAASSFAETVAAVPQPVMAAAVSAPVNTIPAPVPALNYAAQAYTGSSNAVNENDSQIKQLQSELKELSSVVQNLLTSRTEPAKLDRPLLMRLGVGEDIARGMLSDLLAIDDPISLAPALAAKIQTFALPPVLESQQVIAVVGPTGVGKTTTLAKLAAKFALEQGKKVALITADTYRIGAVEQLRTYARIMGVPLEIALSPDEVAAGIEKHQDKDVILIDTVGRSQRSAEHLNELKNFVDAAKPTDTYLVVAASLSQEIQREVVERFSTLSPTRLVVTKLDESPSRGCLVDLPLRTGLGLACMTAGQNVPQDIDMAEAGTIARFVVEVA